MALEQEGKQSACRVPRLISRLPLLQDVEQPSRQSQVCELLAPARGVIALEAASERGQKRRRLTLSLSRTLVRLDLTPAISLFHSVVIPSLLQQVCSRVCAPLLTEERFRWRKAACGPIKVRRARSDKRGSHKRCCPGESPSRSISPAHDLTCPPDPHRLTSFRLISEKILSCRLQSHPPPFNSTGTPLPAR